MSNEGLWQEVEKQKPELTAKRAQCNYIAEKGQYAVTFLNKEHLVEPASRRILTAGAAARQQEAGFLEQLCILAYLINAKEMPLAGKLVNATGLEGGQFFFRGHHCLPTAKLEEAFGNSPERLFDAARQFDARRKQFGDASIKLLILPRVPVTFVIWRGDEEFGARASILFDRTAGMQLPLDALLTAVNLAVDTLIEALENTPK